MAKNNGIHIELIPNMYEIGVFRPAMATRRRLRIITICAVAILCLIFWGVGNFIHHSVSFFINLALIIGMYIGVLLVAYLLAVTIGDVVFSGPWLEKMYKGPSFIPEDVQQQAALLKNKNIYFILMWVLSIVVLGVGCDFCTGRNVQWYQNIGSGLVLLKSDDPDEQFNALEKLSNPFHTEKWKDAEIQAQVISLLGAENETVRAQAAYLVGYARMPDAEQSLVSLLTNTNAQTHTRSEAAIALGRLDWRPARAQMMSEMRRSFAQNHADTEFVPSLLYAFYEMKDKTAVSEAVQILNTCFEQQDCSLQIYQYAFFYLKSLKISEASAVSFKYLASQVPLEQRCYAADILRFASSQSDVPEMKRVFEKTPQTSQCDVVFRKYHSEAAIILFEQDPMRSLLLRAVGNYYDPNDYDWIWMIGSNQNENDLTRKVAEMYTRAMREKGLVK
ncbi:MAG: HEAT repeat domain-containing protein [Proteobacteria bacterium]|nr:HEAT repeat domain-containing protein [Pseudomonadota bacterium]